MGSTTVTAAEGLVHAGKNHLSWGKQLCAQVGFMAAFAPDKENEWERIRDPPCIFELSVTLRPSLRSPHPFTCWTHSSLSVSQCTGLPSEILLDTQMGLGYGFVLPTFDQLNSVKRSPD